VIAAGEYLSTHVPEDGPVGDSGALHALTCGRRGVPVQCFGCQEPGHIITNCQGTSALGATLTYNRSNAPPQRTDTSAQDMARAMSTNAWRRPQQRNAAWKPAPRNFSSFASASTWSVLISPEWQLWSARPGRCTLCRYHTSPLVSTQSWQAQSAF